MTISKITIATILIMQAATLFLLFVHVIEVEQLSRQVLDIEIEQKSAKAIACDTYAKDHSRCQWRRNELEAGQ